ncbi:MAG TPA: BPL-N domain-containing protein [Gemmatimonadaceae bacterium]|jgi:glutamine amidotransferase-like uncharacterized protein
MYSKVLVACLLAIACRHDPSPASILLFDGRGTNANDVAAVERILRDAHLSYATASSRQLGAMTTPQLQTYRLLIVPGGDFVQIGTSLTPVAVATVRNAVHGGLNYLGICAGAFFAGNSPYNGLNLTSGVSFPFYLAEARGIRKAALQIAIAGSSPLEQYWEDGPQLTGWGEFVAKYADGTPAVAQGRFGNGWVMLLGTHPEAPDSWRDRLRFSTSGTAARAYAATLITAALNATPLKHY